jgi:hypothetical protein
MQRLPQVILAATLFLQIFTAKTAYAQEPFASFDFTFGALYPAESAGGIFLGGTFLKPLVQSGALKWELGVGGGFSHRNYQRLSAIASSGQPADPGIVSAAEIDFSRTLVPVAAELSLKLSFMELNMPNFPLVGWLSRTGVKSVAGLKDVGLLFRPKAIYTFLSSDEKFSTTAADPLNPGTSVTVNVSDERRYEGWGWGGEIGMYMTTVSNTTATLAVIYQNTTLERQKGADQLFLPVNQEVDLDGFGFVFSLGFGF